MTHTEGKALRGAARMARVVLNTWLMLVLLTAGVAEAKPTITEFNNLQGSPGEIAKGPHRMIWWLESGGIGGGGTLEPGGRIDWVATRGNAPRGKQVPGSVGDLTIGSDGNIWFTEEVPVAPRDIYGEQQGTVARITTQGSITTFTSGISGEPGAITTGPDGNVWFTETPSGTGGPAIGRITPSGQVTEFTGGLTLWPHHITRGSDGNLWFTTYGSAIGRITPDGQITLFSQGISGEPVDITPGPGGDLWFTVGKGGYYGHHRGEIGKITPGGQVTEYSRGISGSPIHLAEAGPDGNIWFTEDGFQAWERGRIGRITPSGHVVEFAQGLTTTPYDIAVGPDGNMWFTEESTCGEGCYVGTWGRIGRINLIHGKTGKHQNHRGRRRRHHPGHRRHRHHKH
jgi:streptogramin lyase